MGDVRWVWPDHSIHFPSPGGLHDDGTSIVLLITTIITYLHSNSLINSPVVER